MKKGILFLHTVKGLQHGRHSGVVGNMTQKTKYCDISTTYFLQNTLKKAITI